MPELDRKALKEADLTTLDFTVPPFADNGIGGVMSARGEAYLDEYVLSTDEGPDYEPSEDERELLQDFMAGLLNDEAMFGPVRKLLNDRNALYDRAKQLAEIGIGNGQEIARLIAENAKLTARAEAAEQRERRLREIVAGCCDALKIEARTNEMSANLMRDPARTGGWRGAENVARSYDRHGLKVAGIRATLLAALSEEA